jgi:hypothetical protein
MHRLERDTAYNKQNVRSRHGTYDCILKYTSTASIVITIYWL